MAIRKVYSDLKYGFDKLSSGDFSPVYDENSINQSLRTLFSTKKGERFFNPSYGSDIYKYLYEPLDMDTGNRLVDEISKVVNFYEGSRITITKLNVALDIEKLQYNITLIYQIKSTNLTGKFTQTLRKV